MYHENVYNVTQSPLYPPHCHYTMELTVVNDLGQTFVIEVDPNMELENVMALLEAEVRQISTWPVFLLTSTVWDPRFRTKHSLQWNRAENPKDDNATISRRRQRYAPPSEKAQCCWTVRPMIPTTRMEQLILKQRNRTRC